MNQISNISPATLNDIFKREQEGSYYYDLSTYLQTQIFVPVEMKVTTVPLQ